MRGRDGDQDPDRDPAAATARRRAGRALKALPLLAALALGLALAACDSCGDFYWERQPGTCHAHPPPN